jgi:hypothetical protein
VYCLSLCITLVRSRVQMSTTSTPKPTKLKFIFTLYNCLFKQTYLKISCAIRDNMKCDIQSCYSTTLLQLHVTWSKGVEGEHLSLLGCSAMWAGKLLQTFPQHYAPWRTFSVPYDWSIYSYMQRKYTYPASRQPVTFRNAKRTDSNTNPDRAHHTKLLDDDDTALVYK